MKVFLPDRVYVATQTVGIGTIGLSQPVKGYQSPLQAGVPGGASLRYVIEEGDDWEIGFGTYDGGGSGSLTRNLMQSSTGALLYLNGDAKVFITAAGVDIVQPDDLAAVAAEVTTLSGEVDAIALALGNYLPLAGGTMTGFLTLSASPTALLHAATKGYVDDADAALQAGIDGRLPLAGGTMTGPLALPGDPTLALEAAPKQYVDAKVVALITGQVIASSATPIVLTGASQNVLVITGTEAQIVTMPNAASAGLGRVFTIVNLSTVAATVQASNGNAIGQTIEPGMTATYTCISSSGGGAGSWTSSFTGATVRSGTGAVLHAANPVVSGALTLPGDPAQALHAAPKQYVDAKVAARVGEQNITATGLTLLRFDQVPAEAASLVLLFNNLVWAAADLRLNFTNAVSQTHIVLLQASGAAYSAPLPTSSGYTPLTRDIDTNITGTVFMERLGLDVASEGWFLSGVYRSGNTQLTLSGRAIRNAGALLTQPQLSLPASAPFTSGSVTCRWRL